MTKPPKAILDMETRSAVELGTEAHKQAEIMLTDGERNFISPSARLYFDSPLQGSTDPNKNATTVTGRLDSERRYMTMDIARDVQYAAKRMEAHGMDPSVLLEMDYSNIERRMMAALGDPVNAPPVPVAGENRQIAAYSAAAAALGLTTGHDTFRPRPARLPSTARKVAPGLWVMPDKRKKKFKGSKAAKKASRQRR